MRIFMRDTGEVVLGHEVPYGFIPVLVWLTWWEYVAFVELNNRFIEDSYRAMSLRRDLVEHINSLTAIDALRSGG